MANHSDDIDRSDPLWYKDAIIYELHVRAFFDSSGDGMGDFPGLTSKLDYLADLGVSAIWLLPFYPSPWKDDGYDIADYTAIHAAYGDMRDFRRFLREAHRRGLRVVNELVINHTSDQHPWFQRARRAAPGTTARDFYVWSDTPDRYREARIIFKDFESSNWAWDPVARAYYWHRFYSHQPDLNFDNPAVHRAIFRVMDYWFRMGVDGMRLDAIPYLYEREGTNCENLPETHAFLRELRAHLDRNFTGRMFLAEANQWPEETVPYFGNGDECHMSFHFPVMPRLFMAIQMEDRFPIIDILQQTPPIPPGCQWAMFLRNHDELTLEMVTDEERDYMYRMYASDPQARINLGIRRRLAPLLQNNRRKIELMNALLFSLPGTPVLYYGDEIGMGDNIYLGDRNGVRTPMQWSADRNAGFSRANPQRLYLPPIIDPEYHFETVNVEAQQANPSSLLWWTRRLISLRKRYRAFGRGTIEFLYPANRKVLAFIRSYEDQQVLVVANLSRFVQYANLELSDYRGRVPIEVFGRTQFPVLGDAPFFMTLGPHAFYWFELRSTSPDMPVRVDGVVPGRRRIAHAGPDSALLSAGSRPALEHALQTSLIQRRWFQGKARTIREVTIRDAVPLASDGRFTTFALVGVEYVEEAPETYAVPIAVTRGDDAVAIDRRQPQAVIAELGEPDALVHDGVLDAGSRGALLEAVASRRRLRGEHGELVGWASAPLRRDARTARELPNRLIDAEQSNTSIVYDERYVLKLYRRLEDGVSLDLEIGRFLTDHGFRHTPAVLGSLEYRTAPGTRQTVAVVQEYIANEGNAWDLTGDHVVDFFERVAALADPPTDVATDIRAILRSAHATELEPDGGLIGTYAEDARLLGQRTAEMHRVLASETTDPAFAPEPFSLFYQRSLYQSMRNLLGRVMQRLATTPERVPEPYWPAARRLLELDGVMKGRFRAVIERPLSGARIRCHGDYHLGQLLYTGNDFYITDFEGEPIRPLSERRLKRSPLRDVAGMLRSFHYAALASTSEAHAAPVPSLDEPAARAWAALWYARVAAIFLRGYLDAAAGGDFLPRDREELAVLLDAYLLEKAIYELAYELSNRPDWAGIPLAGALELLGSP